MEFIDSIAQIVEMILDVISIILVNSTGKYQKFGPVVGLSAQPAWFFTTVYHGQWAIFVLSIIYSIAWGNGVMNFWIKKRSLKKNGIRSI